MSVAILSGAGLLEAQVTGSSRFGGATISGLAYNGNIRGGYSSRWRRGLLRSLKALDGVTTSNPDHKAEVDIVRRTIQVQRVRSSRILDSVVLSGKPLLIVAEAVEGESLGTPVVNKLCGGLKFVRPYWAPPEQPAVPALGAPYSPSSPPPRVISISTD